MEIVADNEDKPTPNKKSGRGRKKHTDQPSILSMFSQA